MAEAELVPLVTIWTLSTLASSSDLFMLARKRIWKSSAR